MISRLKIVLASSSPRRISIIRKLGLGFVSVSPIAEEDNTSTNPIERVEKNSSLKAENVAKDYPNHLVIGADTVVSLESEILGKPANKKNAYQMLDSLSGNMHTVYTGITVINTKTGKKVTRTASTKVWFKKLTEQQIDDYVDSGEPLDKAGAYGIQGLGGKLVDYIQGSYSNVVGLPTELLLEILSELE